ncbi:unnamed protein product, partial [Dibothriocephalus latus]
SDSEDEPPKKTVAVAKPAVKAAVVSKKASSSSESESDSEDEVPKKTAAVAKPAVKVAVVSKSASSSSESETDSEVEPPKKTVAVARPAVKVAVVSKRMSSSSESESDSEDEPPQKKLRAASMGSWKGDQFSAKKQTATAPRPSLGGDDRSDANVTRRKRKASHNDTQESEESAPRGKKSLGTVGSLNGKPKKPKLNASGDTDSLFNVSSLPDAASTPAQGAAPKKHPRHSMPAMSNGVKNPGEVNPPGSAPRQPFRRVPDDCVTLDPRRADNSFLAKAKGWIPSSLQLAGARGSFGEKADQTLRYTRGKDFRHEKTKKKRGTYSGGAITTDVYSFKFDE